MDRHRDGDAVAGSHDDEGRDSALVRFRATIAHHPLLVGGPLIVVAIVAGFSDLRDASLVSLGAVLVFIVVQLFTLAHDDRLCLRCIAESPADPAQVVERRRRWLRLFHSATTTAGIVMLIVTAAVGVVAGLLIRPGWGDLVLLLPLGTMALTVLHRRVEPWCPYCGWGRDDDGEETPDPTPDPDTAAPLSRT
ncbi:hypothetical protein [Actinomycetospora chiangmaiensis]|uniref:hypothetical protein n=1 Tax=Actinomycetospora chiangmaiensis TaxID=402650 RepID=UPI0012F9A854|nr:hypothetical protein [Actinomycetospora chiangmaiensis]